MGTKTHGRRVKNCQVLQRLVGVLCTASCDVWRIAYQKSRLLPLPSQMIRQPVRRWTSYRWLYPWNPTGTQWVRDIWCMDKSFIQWIHCIGSWAVSNTTKNISLFIILSSDTNISTLPPAQFSKSVWINTDPLPYVAFSLAPPLRSLQSIKLYFYGLWTIVMTLTSQSKRSVWARWCDLLLRHCTENKHLT